MPLPKKNEFLNKICIFVDYIPAELRQNKDWLVVYYAKNLVSEKLERLSFLILMFQEHNNNNNKIK